MQTNTKWVKALAFDAEASQHTVRIDTTVDGGGLDSGMGPKQMLLCSLSACSGMDVVSILEKKRQEITAYRLEIDGVRAEPGTWPRPFLSITMRHIVTGEDLDPVAVARAVELSDEKYCTVVSTLRSQPEVQSLWTIEEA